MLKFSFRRDRDKHFTHIAPGLIPAASIAPKAAVPRTPPPRSPDPSPERPRSALAAAILSSSLTGQTWAIPPARPRSFSDTDRSQSFVSEHNTTAALYNRDRWSSPDQSEDEEELQGGRREEEEQDELQEELQDRPQDQLQDQLQDQVQDRLQDQLHDQLQDEHVYQTLDRQERCSITEPVSVQSIKTKPGPAQPRADRLSPAQPGEFQASAACGRRAPSVASPCGSTDHLSRPRDLKRPPRRSAEPSSLYSEVKREKNTRMGDEQRQLEERLQRLEQEISHSQAFSHKKSSPGSQLELQSLRQHAQELVDENDALKMTVHRLNVELSLYQTRFRPLSKQELDMKYLSPLLLAYEDRMNERDALLQTTEEEVKRLRVRVEEVIKENEKLHQELSKSGVVSQKDCHQLQQQAVLVLQENQVLLDQLEAQHVKAKASHSRHKSEVTKMCKQLMMLEAENQRLQEELEESRREAQRYMKDVQGLQARMKDAVTWDEHCSITGRLRRELEEQQKRSRTKLEELLHRASTLQEENQSLSRDKTNLNVSVRTVESELQLCRQANRRAERKMSALTQQKEEYVLKEEKTRHYLSSVISVAELISHERDRMLHMASTLQQDKHRFISRMLTGTVRFGKLQEAVTVYRTQASSRLAALEEAAKGRTASHQREILHLQTLLRERQEAEEKLLQSKREVEEELELVWKAATRENQQMKETLVEVQLSSELRGWTLRGGGSQAPETQQKHGLDYYC